MSPSEDQLRAALRHGEGDGLSAAGIIARAEDHRRQRRTRLLSVAAAVVVVAGIGTGVGLATTSSHRSTSSEANGAAKAQRAPSAAGDAGGSLALSASCPATAPTLPPQTAGTSGTFFEAPVQAMQICAYQYAGGRLVTVAGAASPLTGVLAADDAQRIADALNAAAPVTGNDVSCDLRPTKGLQEIVVLAAYADGREAPQVIVGMGPCNRTITNGHTTRGPWQPPAVLNAFLANVNAAIAKGAHSIAPRSIGPTTSK